MTITRVLFFVLCLAAGFLCHQNREWFGIVYWFFLGTTAYVFILSALGKAKHMPGIMLLFAPAMAAGIAYLCILSEEGNRHDHFLWPMMALLAWSLFSLIFLFVIFGSIEEKEMSKKPATA